MTEETTIHTRILRLALGIEESRAYWANIDPAVPAAERSLAAFEQRWFGAKSLARVRTLLPYLAARYEAYPAALDVLRRWSGMDPATRQVICHWHMQLSDPIYRQFTGAFLVERRQVSKPTVDPDVVARWVEREHPGRWAAATRVQFASKLLSAAYEAGLVSSNRDPRPLALPRVSDVALAYLLYLLREMRFAGTLTENPYLASVGLIDDLLEARLVALPGVTYRRMGALKEFDWAADSLRAWAEGQR